MRFTINKAQLLKGLGMVSKAVPPKAELPILQNVKMELTEKGLELTGSDSNMSIKTIVPYKIGEMDVITNAKPGETLVPLKIFAAVTGSLEGETINVDLADSTVLQISDTRSDFKLNSIRAEEYPQIDLSPSGAVLEIKTGDLQVLVESAAFAASIKETRPILTALNLEAHSNILTATATDTARLARKSIDIDSDVRFVANIPAKKLVDIVRSFEDADMVSIAVSDTKAIFSFANTTISTRLINGDYPNTKTIVPKTFNYYLEVNAAEFLKAMERVSLLSADHDGVVKLIATEDEVQMVSRSSMVGSANEKLQVFQFSGERLEINFRASFVADAIRALKSEDVTLAFVGEMKPFVVKNVKDDSTDMLLTPLRA